MKNTDDKLIEADLEITAVTAGAALVRLPGKVASVFPALVHRNYQFYFAGQLISVLGFWLQQVGIGWLVFELTKSPFWVGATVAVGTSPFLLFTLFGGYLADRVDKKKLIIATSAAETLFAMILGLTVLLGGANLPFILIIAFLHGTAGAIDLPSRNSFVIEMIGRRDLASAVSLNNAQFNAARFLGPALAGILIATVGVGWTFVINSLSFLPAIAALAAIKPVLSSKADIEKHPLKSIRTGLSYTFSHPQLFYYVILGTLTAILIWPYQILMPAISENVFGAGPKGLGSLLAASGLGSILGALFTSAFSQKINKNYMVLGGILLSASMLIMFGLNRNFALAHLLLFFAGFGALTHVATLNTLVQLVSPDKLRGRIMSVYLTMFIGMIPLGGLLSGIVAQKISSATTVAVGSAIMILLTLFFYLRGVFKNLHVS